MCSAGAVVCAHTLHTVGAVAGDSSTNDGDNNIGDISRVHVFFASMTQTSVLFIVLSTKFFVLFLGQFCSKPQ